MRRIDEKNRLRVIRLVFSISLIAFGTGFANSQMARAQVAYPTKLWMAIIGEATADGPEGMLAVAVCVRNRLNAGLGVGLVAAHRKDLNRFVKREGRARAILAKRIVQQVFEEGSVPDIIRGALYYDNFEKYGIPKWTKGKQIVILYRQGSHTFFNVKPRRRNAAQ